DQLAEDKLADQLTIKGYYDPFTGEPANKSK
ncbi:IS200/IS605 family transposase, partial [bacterium 1xD42-67]